MCPSIDRKPCRDAVDPENVHKNRTRDVLPVDNLARPYLVTYIPGATDYINAVFCDVSIHLVHTVYELLFCSAKLQQIHRSGSLLTIA